MSRRYLSTKNCLTCDGTGKQFSRFKINAAIQKAGLSSKQIAEAIGVTESYVSYLRSGSKPWTPALVRKLEGILKK